MLSRIKVVILTLLALLIMIQVISAETYVSLRGKFFISYPDDWEQLDYVTVDAFLGRQGAAEEMFNYDAVLAPSASSPFFSDDYLIITLDPVGPLTDEQIDSTLDVMRQEFSTSMALMNTDEFLANPQTDKPNYDKNSRTVTVLYDLVRGQDASKKNLVMMKFYDNGIASFFFYSADSVFETSKKTFLDIANSFSTENIESMLPKEQLRVADLKTDEAGNLAEEKSNKILYLSIAILILMGVVVLFVRSKRKV